ncbi:MAG: ABC transporter ATP-binding protein [Eubacterium sp.]|nr:ABC transporter ATP-binding protein [Eubacterium sp.]
MENTVVKVDNLVKRYSELIALDHFSLEIREGEIFGLLGPNGSGKTTTISCLLSLLSYDKGTIEIFGQPMTPTSYDIKRDIGIIMQNVAVFDELTVYENIDCFCGLYIKDKELRKKYVEEAIEFVGLQDFKKFRPKKLSGGLLRRLNIACGIAHKPKLIILDEPTVAVDPQSRNKILEGIVELNRQGATVIYTTHYMEEVEQICSRVAIMDKGKKIAEGTIEELKNMIKHTETVSIDVPELSNEILGQMKELPHVYDVRFEKHEAGMKSTGTGTNYAGRVIVSCSGGKHNLVRILGVLQQADIHFGRVFSELPTLNDVFLEITGTELRDSDEREDESQNGKKKGKRRR